MFYLTQDDASYLNEIADSLGFKSRSRLITAVIERLILGGFSGVTFCKLGWQFASLVEKKPQSRVDLFSAIRPLPPLIGHERDPREADIVPFLNDIKREIKANA